MATLVTYAANTRFLPDDPSLLPFEQWNVQNTPAPGLAAPTASILDKILQIVNPEPGGVLNYTRHEDAKLNFDNVIFEINCRVVSVSPFPGTAPFGFGFFDADETNFEAGLNGEKIFLPAKPGTGPFEFFMDTTDGFHTYRIVKNGVGDVELWVDSAKQLAIPYGNVGKSTPPGTKRRLVFGSVNSGGDLSSEWDIAYVSYSISS